MHTTTARVRCPTMVGRSNELARARRGLEGANRDPEAIAVVGSAGIGKSRLVAELIDQARRRGTRVLVGRCARADRATALQPLQEAFLATVADLPQTMPASLAAFAGPLSVVVPLGAPSASPVDASPLMIAEGLRRVLETIASNDGTLLVVEDLHWADSDTVAVLTYLCRHLEGSGSVIVLTSRIDEPDAPAALGQLVEACADVLELAPLTDDEVDAMTRLCLADTTGLDEAVVDRVRRDAGGLPLVVEDLLSAGHEDHPRRFADLIDERLQAIDASEREILMVAGLAGDEIDADLLQAAMDLRPGAITAALHLGSAQQLLVSSGDQLRFRHALTAQVVAARLGPDERREWAGRLAAAIEARGSGQLGRAAQLWELAGKDDHACAAYLAATRQAERSGAMGIAEELSRAAVRTSEPATALRDEATLVLLGILLASGRHDEVVEVGGHALDELSSAATVPFVRLAIADALLHRGEPAQALVHLDALRRAAAEDLAVAARLGLLDARYAIAVASSDRAGVAAHLAAQAVGLAERAGDPALMCEALALMSLCERTHDLAAALIPLERSLAVAAQHQLAVARLQALNEIGAIELLRDATPDRLERARRSAIELGVPGTLASIELNLAALRVMRGEIDLANDAASTVVDIAEPLGMAPMVAAATMLRGVGAAHAGDSDEMERLLRRAESLAPDDSDMLALAWAAGRGIDALLRERRDDAMRAFERADGYPAPARTLNPARGPLLLLRAVAGDETNADVAAARAAVSADARYPNMWLSFAEAVQHRGDDGGVEALARAMQLAEPYRVFRAVALRLVAEAAIRDGWGDPVAWLRDAEAELVTRSLPRIASACRGLLRQAGAPTTRRRGRDAEIPRELLEVGVTARELEVLELVGERLTNREIAERLFMSPRTVEKHVASLLRKTDTSKRSELVFFAQHL